MFLMLNLLPLWVYRSAIVARDRLAAKFLQYHTSGDYKQGSAYVRRWTAHFVARGIPAEDIARFHNGGLFALVANTVPSAYWMVYRVFSDPVAARECREEVLRTVSVAENKDGTQVCTIDAKSIKNSCPTLISTFQEVFRVHGMANSVRIANEDHLLDGKYLIKRAAWS